MNTTVTRPTLNGMNELYKFINKDEENLLVLINGSIEPSLTKISNLKNIYSITNSNGKTTITVDKKIAAPLLTIINYTSSDNEGINKTLFEYNGDEFSEASLVTIDLSFFDTFYLKKAEMKINLNKSAILNHSLVNLENLFSKNHTKLDARLENNSNYRSLLLSLGSDSSEIFVNVDLAGQGAKTVLNGLYALRGTTKSHFFTTINHLEPHTESDQLYKGILDDDSRGKFHGKIYVAPHAQLIRSSQLNKNLLLSNKAQINSEPQLEIFADDVKCNHGATIGNLDEEQVFYFESRGIEKNKARKMLTYAFAEDILMKASGPSVQKKLKGLFNSNFTKAHL